MMRHPLTPAELRALQALARYETANRASLVLGLSPQTIRNEAQSAYRKLSVRNRTAAFTALGWLQPEVGELA